jgi:TonB family protein
VGTSDRAFEGLLFSLVIHFLLAVLYFNLPAPKLMGGSERTEITILDEKPRPKSKAKSFVTETDKRPDDIKDLNDAADFLSQFTKRVKKQLVARNNGPTRNSQPTVIPLKPKDIQEKNRVAGMETQAKTPHEEGIGLPQVGGNQALHEVAIGPSSIAEFVPGVEEGEFTALNTDQFTYYSFFARINEQIRNRWVMGIRNYIGSLTQKDLEMLSKMDRQTVVEIILNKDGTFSSSVLQHSAGDRTLDQTTVQAFRDAAPFLNPPKGMVENDGMVHLRYGFVVRFRPPLGQAGN